MMDQTWWNRQSEGQRSAQQLGNCFEITSIKDM